MSIKRFLGAILCSALMIVPMAGCAKKADETSKAPETQATE